MMNLQSGKNIILHLSMAEEAAIGRTMRLYYSSDYASAAHAFETTRKAAWIADSLHRYPIDGVVLTEPKPLEPATLLEVHDEAYVRAVLTGDATQSGGIATVPLGPRTLADGVGLEWRHGRGGACGFGRWGSRLAFERIASRASAPGAWLLHLQWIGARGAGGIARGGFLRHDPGLGCSLRGGTARLIENDPHVWQLDVSVCRFDAYESSDRCHSEMVAAAADYLPAIERLLGKAGRLEPGSIYLPLRCGDGSSRAAGDGGLRGIKAEILAERERMVSSWCRIGECPVAFALAGGYLGNRLDQAGLVALHRLSDR